MTWSQPDLLLRVVPLAAGAAVSPALAAASIEILSVFGTRRVVRLLTYLCGAVIVLVLAFAIVRVLPSAPGRSSPRDTGVDIVDIVLGAALLVIAVVLLRPPRPRRPGPSRLTRLTSSRWVGIGVLGLGALMMVTNPSTLLLVAAGAREIQNAEAGVAIDLICVIVLAVGATLPILAPLSLAVVSPKRTTALLTPLQSFLDRHGRLLGIVVSAATGLYLVSRGLGWV